MDCRCITIRGMAPGRKQYISFCYRIAKEAGFASDGEGNPSECYLRLSFGLDKPVDQKPSKAEMEQVKGDSLQAIAEVLQIDASLLTVITEEEYLSATEEQKMFPDTAEG